MLFFMGAFLRGAVKTTILELELCFPARLLLSVAGRFYRLTLIPTDSFIFFLLVT